MQDAPAGGGDLRHVGALVHLRKQHELGRIVRIDRPAPLAGKPPIPLAQRAFALAPIGAPGKREREAVPRQPIDAFDGLVVSIRPALLLMQRLAVMIEAHADNEPAAMRLAKREQA